MATRRTRVTLSIPWDDEDRTHPAGWAFDVLLGVDEDVRPVILVDYIDTDENGVPTPDAE